MSKRKNFSERLYPSAPIVGVGAVILRNYGTYDSDVILIERAKPPMKGVWTLPGGKVRENETLEVAVKREIREECNVEVDVIDLLDTFEFIEKASGRVKYHYIVFDFLTRYVSGEPRAGSDAGGIIWYPVKRLRFENNLVINPDAIRMIEIALNISD